MPYPPGFGIFHVFLFLIFYPHSCWSPKKDENICDKIFYLQTATIFKSNNNKQKPTTTKLLLSFPFWLSTKINKKKTVSKRTTKKKSDKNSYYTNRLRHHDCDVIDDDVDMTTRKRIFYTFIPTISLVVRWIVNLFVVYHFIIVIIVMFYCFY